MFRRLDAQKRLTGILSLDSTCDHVSEKTLAFVNGFEYGLGSNELKSACAGDAKLGLPLNTIVDDTTTIAGSGARFVYVSIGQRKPTPMDCYEPNKVQILISFLGLAALLPKPFSHRSPLSNGFLTDAIKHGLDMVAGPRWVGHKRPKPDQRAMRKPILNVSWEPFKVVKVV